MRVKVTPKMSSQSAGWTVRTRMSVGSCRTLRASHSAMANVLETKATVLRMGLPGSLRAGGWEAER